MTESTFRTARVFDGTGTDGKPLVDRHMLDTTEAERVLTYLESAPTIMPAYRFGPDRVDRTRGRQVPLTWHTDGTWVWPGAVSYYLRTYAMPPHADLLAHIRQRQYEAETVEPAVKLAALAAVSGSTGDRAAEEEDHAVSTSMSAEAPVMAGSAASDDSAAFDRLRSAAVDLGAPVGAYRIGASADGAWCLFRDGSRWTVFLADRGTRKYAAAFDTSQQAIAYLVGQLYLANKSGATVDEVLPSVAGGKVATTVDAPAVEVSATATEPTIGDALDHAGPTSADEPAEPAVASAPVRPAPPTAIPSVAVSSAAAPVVAPSVPLAGLAAAGRTARKMQSPFAGDDLAIPYAPLDEGEQPPALDVAEPPAAGQSDEPESPAARRPGAEALFGRRRPGTDPLPDSNQTTGTDSLLTSRQPTGTDLLPTGRALTGTDASLTNHEPSGTDSLSTGRTPTGTDSPPANRTPTGTEPLAASHPLAGTGPLAASRQPSGTEPLPGGHQPSGADPLPDSRQLSGTEPRSGHAPDAAGIEPLSGHAFAGTDPLPSGRQLGSTDSGSADRTPTSTESSAADAQPATADDAAHQPASAAAALPSRQSVTAAPATQLASSTQAGYPAGGRPDTAASPSPQPAPWRIQPLPGEPPLTLYRDKRLVMLPTGTEVDRYGEPDGNVTYAARTQYQHRSLPSDWSNNPYHVYRLQRPIEALTGFAVPWFEQPGGGTAFVLPGSINDLLADGALVEITVRAPQPQPVQG